VEVSVLRGSITSVWHTSFGLFACLDFGPLQFVRLDFGPLQFVSFFLPFLGVFFLWSLTGFHGLDTPVRTPNCIPCTWVYIWLTLLWTLNYQKCNPKKTHVRKCSEKNKLKTIRKALKNGLNNCMRNAEGKFELSSSANCVRASKSLVVLLAMIFRGHWTDAPTKIYSPLGLHESSSL
jgi:hypothetical protein